MPTTNLGIEYVSSNLTQPEVPINTAFDVIDAALAFSTGAWTAYTPTLSSNTGTLTTTTKSGSYKQIGKSVLVRIIIGITNNGTGGGFLLVSLPVAAKDTSTVLNGRENGVSGKVLGAACVDTTHVAVTFYDNTYPGATGASLVLEGVYEAA